MCHNLLCLPFQWNKLNKMSPSMAACSAARQTLPGLIVHPVRWEITRILFPPNQTHRQLTRQLTIQSKSFFPFFLLSDWTNLSIPGLQCETMYSMSVNIVETIQTIYNRAIPTSNPNNFGNCTVAMACGGADTFKSSAFIVWVCEKEIYNRTIPDKNSDIQISSLARWYCDEVWSDFRRN